MKISDLKKSGNFEKIILLVGVLLITVFVGLIFVFNQSGPRFPDKSKTFMSEPRIKEKVANALEDLYETENYNLHVSKVEVSDLKVKRYESTKKFAEPIYHATANVKVDYTDDTSGAYYDLHKVKFDINDLENRKSDVERYSVEFTDITQR